MAVSAQKWEDLLFEIWLCTQQPERFDRAQWAEIEELGDEVYYFLAEARTRELNEGR